MSKGSLRNVEKVVVIQTYEDVNSWGEGIKWLFEAMADLNPGDELILVALVHHTSPPRAISFSAAKFFGYKSEEDHNKTIVQQELKRRKEELRLNPGIMQLNKLFQVEKKVKLSVKVEAASSHKVAAVRAAKRLGATWIILDREMKKEKQYFMDRLSCKISSMKCNNTLVELRGSIDEFVIYDEMNPSYSWEDLSQSPQSSQRTISSHEMAQYSHSTCFTDTSQSSASTSSFMEKKRSPVHTPVISNILSSKKPIVAKQKSPKTLKNDQDLQKTTKNKDEDEGEFVNSVCSECKNRRPKIGLQRDFTYQELHEATNGFSKDNFISEGGFGFVFKGKLKKDGLEIAVKQHKAASLQGDKEFRSEVRVLSRARHQNLVMLLGSCSQGSHRLLVYEYVCNGSLEQHLSGDSVEPLDWGKRIKIALGAAKGLKYLHARNIVHRDMRPSNILITHDHESLLGDFGLAKAAQQGDTTSHSSENGVVGTLGYVAPEYAESGKMSTKTDVYSFGVVLLQLITGKRTTDEIPEGKSLIGWAKPLLETKNYPGLIDKRIVDSHDVHQLFWMVRAAEECLKKNPDVRCTMEQIVHYLNFIGGGRTNFITEFSPTAKDSNNSDS